MRLRVTLAPGRNTSHPMNLDRETYVSRCAARWCNAPFVDAYRNWDGFEAIKGDLIENMRAFRRDPFMATPGGTVCNPEGTLTALLWKLQDGFTGGDKSKLCPLLDFDEHYQEVFLRRGLRIYCAMILEQLNAEAAVKPDEIFLPNICPEAVCRP